MAVDSASSELAVKVSHIAKKFVSGRQGVLANTGRVVKAVVDASLEIRAGQTMGLIGESGSGKTTVGRCVALLEKPDSGDIASFNIAYSSIKRDDYRRLRGAVQMVFQDSRGSIDPRWTVRRTLEEPLRYLQQMGKQDRGAACRAALGEVGLSVDLLDRYRHQLSGGQLQRVNIARALMAGPRLIVLDEPTASVDAALRRQITSLLKKLQDERGLSYLLISHDIRHVLEICDRVAVMWRGTIVECGEAGTIMKKPVHPYTRWFLLASRGDDAGNGLMGRNMAEGLARATAGEWGG